MTHTVTITRIEGADTNEIAKALRFVKGIGKDRAQRIAMGEAMRLSLTDDAVNVLQFKRTLVNFILHDHVDAAAETSATETGFKGDNMTNTNTAANELAEALGKALAGAVNEDRVRAIVQKQINEAMAGIPTTKIELSREGAKPVKLDGLHHPMFPKLLKMVACRGANGYVPNIWIAGEKSSGKSHAGRAVAEALGLPFYVMGTLAMSFEALGFVDGNGKYHSTPFVDCFINGGVLQMDEIDSYEPHPTLCLNGPLANNCMTLPDGRFVERHKDCIIIGGGNTWGMGATNDYIGRNKLDAAFLSRFPAKLSWNIDPALEQQFCGNAKFAERVQRARARAKVAGLKLGFDTRHSAAGAAFIAGGFTEDEAADLTYLAGLTDEQRKIVEGV